MSSAATNVERMENPTHSGPYTEADLRKYAAYRAEQNAKANASIVEALDDESLDYDDLSAHDQYREPLCYDEERILNITLSTGGDADGYRLKIDENGEIMSGVYYWADWGVYQEVPLDDDELENIERIYNVSGMTERF